VVVLAQACFPTPKSMCPTNPTTTTSNLNNTNSTT
jgi:hypothetical protein